jgi:hypothetical protein
MTATTGTSTIITEPGVYLDIPNEVYHADPVPGGSLSSTGARLLLEPSCPALFRWAQDHPRKTTADQEMGQAAHSLGLGAGPEVVEVEADSWRTSAAKTKGEEVRAAGGIPLLTERYEVAKAMAEVLAAHPLAGILLGRGSPEASLFYVDQPTGCWLRARLDMLPPDPDGRRMIIPDYKTAKSAEPGEFAKSVANYGYHQQAAWYEDAVKAMGLADDVAFVFLVQEKEPPYLITPVELDAEALRIGRYLNRQAIEIYAECTRTGEWPGYYTGPGGVALTSLPYWYEKRFEAAL